MLGDSIAAVIGFKSSPEAVAGGEDLPTKAYAEHN